MLQRHYNNNNYELHVHVLVMQALQLWPACSVRIHVAACRSACAVTSLTSFLGLLLLDLISDAHDLLEQMIALELSRVVRAARIAVNVV